MHCPFAWMFGALALTPANELLRDDDGQIVWGNGVTLEQTWRAMETLVDRGLVCEIGESSYSAALLNDLLQYERIRPALIQCEGHVMNSHSKLREVCASLVCISQCAECLAVGNLVRCIISLFVRSPKRKMLHPRRFS